MITSEQILEKFKYHPSRLTTGEANRLLCNIHLDEDIFLNYDNFFKIKGFDHMKLIERQTLPLFFIAKHKDYWGKTWWREICAYQKLPESFIREYEDYVDWLAVFKYQNVSVDFAREFKDRANWVTISYPASPNHLNEQFVDKYKDFLYWTQICDCVELSEQFMREHERYLDWNRVSVQQKMSEQFIEDYKNKLDWGGMASWYRRNKTVEWIDRWKDYLNWHVLTIDYHWNMETLKKFRDRINFKTLMERHMGRYNNDKISRYTDF